MGNNFMQGGVPTMECVGGLNADNVPVLPEGGETPRGARAAELQELCRRTAALRARCRLDPTIDYTINYAFSMNGIGFAPTGDLVAVTAQKKQGKTLFETVLLAAAMHGEYMGIRCNIPDARCLLFDAEQGLGNTLDVYRRICYIAGIDGKQKHERLNVMRARECTIEERNDMLLAEIEEYRPNLVLIDGIKDLCGDFNDLKESNALISNIMRVAQDYDCTIFNVLHTNYGSEKMRGHLGTELGNKATDVFMCRKNSDITPAVFSVTQEATRNADIEVLRFTMQTVVAADGSLLAIPAPLSIQSAAKEQIELDNTFRLALADGHLKYSGLVSVVMEQKGIKRTLATELIKEAMANGIIAQDPVVHKYRYMGLRPTDNADKLE